MKAAYGRIIADSAEGYKSEQECLADIDGVKGSKDATNPVGARGSEGWSAKLSAVPVFNTYGL